MPANTTAPPSVSLRHRPSRAKARAFPGWHVIVAGFAITQTIGATDILDRMVYGEWDFKQTDKLVQSLNLLLIFSELALFARGLRLARRLPAGGMWLIALAIFLTCSALWSLVPPTSARRGILFLIWVLGAIGMAANFPGDAYCRLFGGITLASALISLLLLAVAPHAVLLDGILRGVYTHKSVLGQAMAAGALLSLHGMRAHTDKRWRGLLMLLIYLAAVIVARSTTSLLVIVALIAVELIIALIARGGAARLLGIALICVLLPGIGAASIFSDDILLLLGKDPGLTGRSDLWAYVWQAIAQRPVLGWGLMAFWSTDNPIALGISAALGWIVPQAHNGLLELLLSVGVVGTSLFAFLLARNAVIAVRCLSTPARNLAITLLLAIFSILLIGGTESVLIDPAQPAMNLLFVTGLLCEYARDKQR